LDGEVGALNQPYEHQEVSYEIVAALLAANAAFGQTVSVTGQLTALSDT